MAKRVFSKRQHILFFLEAIIIIPVLQIISLICPYHKLYDFSKKIGKFFLFVNSNKLQIVEKNLKIIFPDKQHSQKEIYNIATIISGFELRVILEMIALTKMSFQDMISYIRIIQKDELSKVYHTQGDSFVGFTLHYGNWELLGCFLNNINIPLACLVERQFNPWIDKYLQYLRKKLGIILIYNEISLMKPLLYYMKKGGGVALVADQTYWFAPLFIPFFNHEAAVPQGSASLAIKMNSSLFCGYTTYLNKGIYSVNIDTNVISDGQAINTLSEEELMKIIYKKYENIIVQDISNWYTLGTDRWGLTKEILKEWEKNPDSTRF